MPELWEVEEELEDTETAARMRLLRVGREADFVEHLLSDLKDGGVKSWELPSILENLGARLAKLARPASSRQAFSQRAGLNINEFSGASTKNAPPRKGVK